MKIIKKIAIKLLTILLEKNGAKTPPKTMDILPKAKVTKDAVVLDIPTSLGNVPTEFPRSGGIKSYIPGHEDHPFPGMPDDRITSEVSVLKRMLPVVCKHTWCILQEHIPPTNRYSRPVRELYRALSVIREREDDDIMRGQWTEIRDIFCMFMEFDDTYRFRFMEFIKELKREEFEFTDDDKHWAEQKWKFKWHWQ